jgi:hypothetical protein
MKWKDTKTLRIKYTLKLICHELPKPGPLQRYEANSKKWI